MYGEVVDSIVVEPFIFDPNLKTPLNASQKNLFKELLITELQGQPHLRVFDTPPTQLPNTLIIAGRLTEFEVRDLPGKEFFLREIHLGVELRFRKGNETATSRRVMRRLSYQKIYLPDVTVAAIDFDLHAAISEITVQFTEIMYPSTVEGGIRLATARDPVIGIALGHPTLRRGNQMAADGRFARAKELWRLVLFDPTQPEEEELFRISPRTLLLLEKQGIDKGMLRRLAPLTRLEPRDLLDFRNAVRRQLGGFDRIEPILLKVADHHRDARHLNLAAAHRNLAVLFWMESRKDLVSYHLARAQANYPNKEYLEKWIKVQQSRDLIPVELLDDEAMALYMRLPAPRSTIVSPGVAEESLFPPLVFESSGTEPVPTEKSVPVPADSGESDAPLKPVPIGPPPSPDADSADLPPVQSPEQADRQTSSASGG